MSEDQSRRTAASLAALAIAGVALGVWLFPHAFPTVALQQRVTRRLVLQRADSFFAANAIAPSRARTAVRFESDDALMTFVELAAGGDDTLNALVRGRDVAPFDWSVRAFVPGDVHEARVDFAPDGRLVGFSRTLAEADVRPPVSVDSGEAIARRILVAWLGESPARWRLATTSYETRKVSGRIDRTYTFERVSRQVGGAPIRLDIVIDGDTPADAAEYVQIPETFTRRYAQMRSANDAIEEGATLGILAIVIVGAIAFRRAARDGRIRWRGPLIVGGVVGSLLVAAALNDVPGSWFDYDTATSAAVFLIKSVITAVVGGVAMGVVVALTLAAAEAAERLAFPNHPDWWKLWSNRGTREIAGRVAGGYAVAAVDFAYVAFFYIVVRHYFGWWVPSELLDDPNQIATPMPWVTGIANSLQAGVWEESLFRALPLSILSVWVGTRPRRGWWMAAGVCVSALIFGCAHANYTSWPPYSRGAEIFLDACLWGAIFLRFGILVTVVAHFTYDLVLFALFTASGSAPSYRVAGAVMLATLLAPALAVGWRWARQRRLVPLGDEGRMAAWEPEAAHSEVSVPVAEPIARATGRTDRRVAYAVIVVALLAAVIVPSAPVIGVRFTADRARVEAAADSTLEARGIRPIEWRKLATTATGDMDEWPRFLSTYHASALADSLARSFEPPAWWIVRYVHVDGTTGARAEEWRVRLLPDGTLLDVHHIVPDSAHGDSLSDAAARQIARVALAGAGLDTGRFVEAKLDVTPRPARLDVQVTYTDTSLKLPGEALARVWVSLAGSVPVLVRRGIELPEAFERADRARQDRLSLIRSASGLTLLLGVVIGLIAVMRGRPQVISDQLDRTVVIALTGTVAVLAIGSAANALPDALALYDTAIPWSTFLGTTTVGVVLSGLAGLVVLGLWMMTDALRRRAGVPLAPDTAAVGDSRVTGVALGSAFALAAVLASLRDSTPGVPQTFLDRTLPVLTPLLGLAAPVSYGMLGLAILVLLIVNLSRRNSVRVLVVAVAFGVVLYPLLAGLAAEDPARFGPSALALRAAESIAELAVLVAVLRVWAFGSVWSWVSAALTFVVLTKLHDAMHAATRDVRAAGVIAAVAGGAALAAWLFRPPRRSARAPLVAEV